METNISTLLKRVHIFSGLENTALTVVSERCESARFDRGSEVLHDADKTTDIFFVLEGSLLAKGYSPQGKEVTYMDIYCGDMFGEFAAIDLQPRSASIHACEPSLVARMSATAFRELILELPEVGLKLSEVLVSKLRRLTQRVFEFSTMTVRYRVQAELMRFCEELDPGINTITIRPAPTHYEIATRVSTHREAVSREISHLESEGVVISARQHIIIKDVARLREMIGAVGM